MADLDKLTPKEIVAELDKYIIGQMAAKRSVAIALRNRMRRQKLPEDLKDEVAPKNIIMIGPTGVGKTEIARRLSKLSGAPFIKVEATKYTEVGYVGRDVESMVRDLVSESISMVKNEMQETVKDEAEKRAEEEMLNLLLPDTKQRHSPLSATAPNTEPPNSESSTSHTREKLREMLRKGQLDDKTVEVDVSKKGFQAVQMFSGTNFEEIGLNMENISNLFGGKKKKKSVKVKQALEILKNEEMDKLVDMDNVSEIARQRVEDMGIIFLDEIDKIASGSGKHGGPDVSREGVQRDILPIVEGSKVHTRYGIVDTSHILFIAAGAFHMSKPSDLIPELQGRFPLRVELESLTTGDFIKILTQPENALIKQYVALLETEGVKLEFDEESITQISEIASEVNSKTENIGARRLHTIMEHLLEEISFTASDISGQTVKITKEYVNERLKDIVEDRDLTRFIL